MKNLRKWAIFYEQLCLASVRTDMAKRIMHSLLPSVAPRSQVSSTGGVVDYKALDAAVEGRTDIIRLGIRACTRELYYYKDKTPYDSNYYSDLESLANTAYAKKDYLTCIDLCIKAFSDTKGWDEGFGGYAWQKIAVCLKKLLMLDKSLKDIQDRPYFEDKLDRILNIKKQVLMELNIFDGLSHNSASILTNIVNEEDIDHERNKPGEEVDKVLKLMDSKELNNPVHVYKEIEDTLKGSGDIHRYKDWTWRLRNHPDYLNSNSEERMKALFLIRVKKLTGQDVYKAFEYKQQLLKLMEETPLDMREVFTILLKATNCVKDLNNSLTVWEPSTPEEIKNLSEKLLNELDPIYKSLKKNYYILNVLNGKFANDSEKKKAISACITEIDKFWIFLSKIF